MSFGRRGIQFIREIEFLYNLLITNYGRGTLLFEENVYINIDGGFCRRILLQRPQTMRAKIKDAK